jgi:hypothetical protein
MVGGVSLTGLEPERPFMLLAVREDGDETGGDYWLPIVDPGSPVPRLSAGEQNLFSGSAHVKAQVMAGNKWQPAWALPSPANVLITPSRLTFVCRDFVKAGTSIGFGGLGAAVALTSTAIRQARAARMRRGKAAVGQVRFEWLANMILTRTVPAATPLVRNPAPVVAVYLTTRNDAGQHVRLVLHRLRPEITAEMLAWHAQDIACRRLESTVTADLDESAINALRTLTDNPAGQPRSVGTLLWTLPGASQPTGLNRQSADH